GVYSDSSKKDLSASVTWTSGTPAVASISAAGLATALTAGSTTIMATSGGVSGSTTLTVKGEYLYATDYALGHVLQYTIGNDGTLTPMATPFVSAGGKPTRLAIDPTHHFLYVANFSSGNVSQYTIGATGSLTPMTPATVVAGAGANAVTIDASGTHAYVPNAQAGTVSQFAIGANGALTPLAPASVAGANGAAVMAINSAGTFAYVVNYFGNSISLFSINAGLLTHVSDTPVTGPPGNTTAPLPNSLVIDPTGMYLYTADSNNNSIGQFSINAGTGALTPLAPNAYVTQGAHSLAILQQGAMAYVYASNSATGSVAQFAINAATGDLGAPIGVFSTAPAGTTSPISVTFDPTNKFAYAANEGNQTIAQFLVGASGAFTAQAPATVATGPGSGPVYMLTTTAY
ncbi:MAG: lactonase family protein, partial [Pseudomonadota bacterium]|nr:lactonase family protein [Pseudomonadota bacterium]